MGGTDGRRRHQTVLLVLVAAVAATGGGAAALAGARWWGAVAAAVAAGLSSFAPTLADRLRERQQSLEERRKLLAGLSEPPPAGPRVPPSRALLLDPEQAIVPFSGRTAELADLLEWCLNADRAVKLLIGAGGVGKTRLALRLTEEVASQGWAVIVVRPDGDLGSALDAEPRRPLLLVIDYAETRKDLGNLLVSVGSKARDDPGRVRVLLLARDSGQWLERLRFGADLPPFARALVPRPGGDGNGDVIKLEARDATGCSASAEVLRAIPYFAKALGVPELRLPEPQREWDTTDAPLLVLHAQALVYTLELAEGASPDAPPGPDAVVHELLAHERVLWAGALTALGIGGLDQRTLDQAVAVLCLFPVRNAGDAARLLGAAPALRGRDDSFLSTIAWRLRDVYPENPPSWWGSLAPDLIAEWLVAESLTRPGDTEARGLAQELIARLQGDTRVQFTDPDEVAAHGFTVLIRASKHHEELAALMADIAEGPMSPVSLRWLSELFPFPTTALAGAALATARRVVAALGTDDSPPEAASAYRVLGVRLIDAGRQAEAAEPLNEAVRLYRALAELDPRYRERLANTLVDVGAVWLEQDRPDLAAPVLHESIAHWRALSSDVSREYLGSLASALMNLGTSFGQTNRLAEAIEMFTETLAVSERAIGNNARDWSARRYRAAAHTNLSIYLRFQGRVDEAEAAAESSVAAYRALAEVDRDKYQPELANALGNLGAALAAQGRRAEALAAHTESAELFAKLALVNPGRFQVDHADELMQVGIAHTLEDRLADAVKPLAEAVTLYMKAGTSGLEVKLADAQMTLCTVLSTLRVDDRALGTLLGQWVASERKLTESHPARAEQLASALRKYGSLLSRSGADGAGLPELQEAAAVYSQLGDGHQRELAATLIERGQLLLRAKPVQPSTDFEDAVELLRPLAEASPAKYQWNLTEALVALGGKYLATERPADAVLALEDAVEAARRAEELKPGTVDDRADFTMQHNLGSAWRLLNRPAEAAACLDKAIPKLEAFAAADPRLRATMPRMMEDYAQVLDGCGRGSEAVRYRERAEEIRRQLPA